MISNVLGNNNNLVSKSNCNSSSSIPSRPMSSDSNHSNSISIDARNPCSDRLPNSGDQSAILNPYFFLKKNRSITIGAAAAFNTTTNNTTNTSKIIKVSDKNDDKENIDP